VKNNALGVDPRDNVVIALTEIAAGESVWVGERMVCEAAEDIRAGFKIAREPIVEGGIVTRYGEPIVEATRAIRPGESVHVHNTRPIPGDLTE
jgi:hypothetical protein